MEQNIDGAIKNMEQNIDNTLNPCPHQSSIAENAEMTVNFWSNDAKKFINKTRYLTLTNSHKNNQFTIYSNL